MSNIYIHKQNSRPLNFARIIKLVLVSIIILAFTTVAKAQPLYECDVTADGSCVIYLETVLHETATVDDALAFCEYYDGVYDPEEDTCTLPEGVHHD